MKFSLILLSGKTRLGSLGEVNVFCSEDFHLDSIQYSHIENIREQSATKWQFLGIILLNNCVRIRPKSIATKAIVIRRCICCRGLSENLGVLV